MARTPKNKKIPSIKVCTHPNGYSLKVEGHKQEYMYFSPEALVEGVMVHIGLKMTDQLSAEMIKSFIDSALEWNNLKASHSEITKLQRRVKDLEKIRLNAARKTIEERNRTLRLCKLARKCMTGHHSLTDALAELHAEVHKNAYLKELTLKDLGITSDQITDDNE